MRFSSTSGRRVLAGLCVVALLAALAGPAAASDRTSHQEAAAPAPEVRVPRVAFYGDSLGYNAESELRAAIAPLYPFTYRAAGGAAIEYWRDAMRWSTLAATRPDTLVIELGTADAGWDHTSGQFERDVRGLLDALSPRVPCIRWFDIRSEPSMFEFVNKHAVSFNRILWRVAAEYPNVEIIHYSAWATLAHDGDYWWPDLLHHNAAGRREMARLARQAAVGCDPSRTTGPFWDVPDDDPAATAVAWMAARGITQGYPNHTFRAVIGGFHPPTTRADALRYLWRLAGSPTGLPAAAWPDTRPGLAGALAWSGAIGALPGYRDGTWRPDDPVTRAQLVQALWRLAGAPTGSAPSGWTDVPASLTTAFDWAASIRLLSTSGGGRVYPRDTLTRSQTARLLYAYHRARTAPPATTTTTSTTTTSTTAPTVGSAPPLPPTPPPTSPTTSTPSSTLPVPTSTTTAPSTTTTTAAPTPTTPP